MEVQEFIAKLQSEVEEKERKQREEKLISLGLYEEKEKILDASELNSYTQISMMKSKRGKDGSTHYYIPGKVAVAVSDEEYAQICELLAKKALLDGETKANKRPEDSEPPFQIEMRSGSKNSGYAFFFKIIAWVLWIGGAILAVMTSFVQVGYGDTEFRFTLFLPTTLTYLLYGGAAMCAAEMLENIASIRTALQSIRFRKK